MFFGRLQREGGSFPAHVSSVRYDFALVSKFNVSEQEVIDNVLERLNPFQRSCFIFQICPSN